jgi:molybdate transport system ATP-binding protein
MIKARLKKQLFTVQGKTNLEIDFEIKKGEFAAIFGKSGTGKTTILRMLAGLADPEEGYIQVDGQVWFDSCRKINLPPQKRQVGFAFENYALFPNMTVRQNLEFALARNKKKSDFTDELLKMSGLKEFAGRRPTELSGGQKQRVALIRAIARKSKIFLFDEPLSALDTETRLWIQNALLKIYRRFDTTTILVSHDLPEVFKLSHLVFMLEAGKIIRSGKPVDVFIGDKLSEDLTFAAEIIDVQKPQNAVVVRVGNRLVQITPRGEDLAGLNIGAEIMVTARQLSYSFKK